MRRQDFDLRQRLTYKRLPPSPCPTLALPSRTTAPTRLGTLPQPHITHPLPLIGQPPVYITVHVSYRRSGPLLYFPFPYPFSTLSRTIPYHFPAFRHFGTRIPKKVICITLIPLPHSYLLCLD
ncbi:hypothetical protein P154DRAFT_126430 [Amniculicola lignicola CBS 123094]|uniref:Uncharacterized protein n=1 Tax=Amniculicola lignicola CBS 123094 TaxID=1392246 RepID=A0A6A5WLS2_9PLEO|nr:hypothetical protein P154DRAFT_126430 [Amniculicola lignicola CBS 123094]